MMALRRRGERSSNTKIIDDGTPADPVSYSRIHCNGELQWLTIFIEL